MNATEPATQAPESGRGKLGVWDTVCIIVGIVIGSSIFKTPPIIFENILTPWGGLGIWLLGGALSLVGALCYAELATTYPKSGGDYVYLTRAFGRPVGFLFGWAQLVVILSGSTGAMAFIFGQYASELFQIPGDDKAGFVMLAAFTAVFALSLLNFFGVVFGKKVQDLLVVLKLIGLALIVIAGLIFSSPDAFSIPEGVTLTRDKGIGVALILVLYAYGGWNDAAFVASDLREPRTITKALVLGTLLITGVYLLVNLAYILSYGWLGIRQFNPALAVGVLEPMSGAASKIIAILVMISALGAINGLIFTGSRVYASLGAEHRVFSLLGKWNPTFKAPINAILVQAAITLIMIVQVGTETGRQWTDNILTSVGIPSIPWGRFFNDGFDTLFAGTAPVFWIFFLLTGLSVFALRAKDPALPRPFRLAFPWYPLLPLVFCCMCIFGIHSAINYAGWVSLIGFVPLAIGVPLYLISSTRSTNSQEHQI